MLKIQSINEWIETYKQPYVMAAITFAEIFPIVLIITIISTSLLKRK